MTERQLGIDAFRQGRLREAVDRLRAAAADHDRTVSLHVGIQIYAHLGAALYALGDAAGAADMFSAAVSLHAASPIPLDLLMNLANASLASGRRQTAEQVLIRALNDNPGAMEARLVLERLRSRSDSRPITGVILGESPESVKRYMDTLSFSSTDQGYSPDEVRAALTQIHHYVDTLTDLLAARDRKIAAQDGEIERLRQTEETLIENMMQARQEADRLRESPNQQSGTPRLLSNGQGTAGESEAADLTPLEKLFQKKS